MQTVDLSQIEFTPDLVSRMDGVTARLYETLPVREEGSKLFLAMAPRNVFQTQDDELQAVRTELQIVLHRQIEWVLADREQLRRYITKIYPWT